MSSADNDASPRTARVRDPKLVALERVAIRTRERGVTEAAWCLSIESRDGSGKITLVDASDGASLYRGDGIFLGWPRSDLEAAYRLWRPDPPPDEPTSVQFG